MGVNAVTYFDAVELSDEEEQQLLGSLFETVSYDSEPNGLPEDPEPEDEAGNLIEKHGSHDQKTHGRRKTMAGAAPANDQPASNEAYMNVARAAKVRSLTEPRPAELGGYKPPARFEDRLGRCYELSFNAVTHPGSKATLVHGSIYGPGGEKRIPHSWTQLSDGTVYDPVMDQWYSEREYAKGFAAVPAVRYNRIDVLLNAVQKMHMGPWHQEPFGEAWYAEFGED